MGREILKKGSKISLKNSQSEEIIDLEIISEPLGEGSSCIVYEARSGDSRFSCKFRLKELYPESIKGIYRDENNQLIVPESCREDYMKASGRFEKSLDLLWKLAYSDDTGCYTVCPLGEFEGRVQNGISAKYLITQWLPSDSINTVNLCGKNDLKLAVKICLKTAAAIKEFHKKGYINFDIKPENILYSPKNDTIAFFDTDTVFKIGEETDAVSFSDGAAPEIANGYKELYSEKSDIFSVGSMLHRFITGKNYFPGQYSLNDSEAYNDLGKYDMCKNAAPEVLSLIYRIFKSCNSGNPAKRCDTESLFDMLGQLDILLDSQVYVINSELAFSGKEIDDFYCKEKQRQKADTILNNFYSVLFFAFSSILITLMLFSEKLKNYAVLPCIICLTVMLILKEMIFGRSKSAAISKVCTDNCFDEYKTVLGFINALDNSQLFEISAPDFISDVEAKRHSFRIIIGSCAIAAGVISAFISFFIESFPLLIASYALILLIVLMADYTYSTQNINNMYNSKFGSDKNKKNIKDIYSFKTKNIKDLKLSRDCIRYIFYNEYKIRCNDWGCADVITKMLAGVIVFLLAFHFFPTRFCEYFHISGSFTEYCLFYSCNLIYCILSSVMVIASRKFYNEAKDILFSIYTDNDKIIREKYSEYLTKSKIREKSVARGIYNHTVMNIENGVPIHKISEDERPTFEQYCTSQKARAKTYFLLVTVTIVCIVVWHFEVNRAFIPIISTSAIFQLWYYKFGTYAFNKMRFKSENETNKQKYHLEFDREHSI